MGSVSQIGSGLANQEKESRKGRFFYAHRLIGIGVYPKLENKLHFLFVSYTFGVNFIQRTGSLMRQALKSLVDIVGAG